jgi:hypothetical protein
MEKMWEEGLDEGMQRLFSFHCNVGKPHKAGRQGVLEETQQADEI